MCIDKERTSAGLYGGMLPVVDTCPIPHAHVLYMGCGKGRNVNGEPMYKGSGIGWGWDWDTGAHRLWTTVDVNVD